MSIETLKARLPDFARDQRINLGAIASSTALTPAQAWGVAIACATLVKDATLRAALEAEAGAHATPELVAAARGAATVMGMNNVYYRFLHFVGEGSDYAKLPARLRMQIIGKPGVPQLDFELMCLAASAISGCESCVRSHERVVREKGGTLDAVQDAVRIAAIVNATSVALAAA